MGFLSKKWQVGRIAGFPIEVNLSFLLLLGMVFLMRGGLMGVLLTVLTFASVLVHELGHAVVARRRGVRIGGIELQFFGGVAKMVTPPRSARDEIVIAAAGPAVSLAIATLGLAGWRLLGSSILFYIGFTNVILGVFNLLPALPMDGGRIYRALLARRRGVIAATRSAVTLSKWVAIGLAALGIFSQNYFLAVLALMIYLMSRAELQGAWSLRYHDTPAEPIDVDVLDAEGRVVAAPQTAGTPTDEWGRPLPWGQGGGTSGTSEDPWTYGRPARFRRTWVYRR
ncbi:MAG TPA: site-2 protease family protein [Polyangia bacterium]|jgi:Zn-dependent protease